MSQLNLYATNREGVAIIERAILAHGAGRHLRILEAGCGNRWPVDLKGQSYELKGVDIDRNAVHIRQASARLSDSFQCGDLRNRGLFPAQTFDVIYNSYVLEHIKGAEHVLDNFRHWLAPGGLLVLRIPDRDSVYGFVTRHTPMFVHIVFKKYIKGNKNAGKPGYDPYPVFYDPVVSRRGIHTYCRKYGCTIRDEAGYSGYLPRAARQLLRVGSFLSAGRLAWRHNNLLFCIIP